MVFDLARPAGRRCPVLVSVPHAGTRVPPEVEPLLLADDAILRGDADLYVDRLYEGVVALGATLLRASISRFVIDLNRAPTDVDREAVPDHPSASASDARRGLIWRISTGGRLLLKRTLTLAELQHRIDQYYEPYHAVMRNELAGLREEFGFVILVDGHSMPSVGRADHADSGRRRADVVPGVQGGQSCHASVLGAAVEHFTERGFTVEVDKPYRGGYITRHYGHPQHNVHAIQIEVSRDLYMDEQSFEVRDEGFARLRDALHTFVERMGTLAL